MMPFAGLGVYIITIAFNTRLHAQQPGDASALNYHAPVNKKTIATNSHKSFLENFLLAEINVKAVRHFTRSFEEAEHVQWYQTYNGVVAYFTVKGIKTRAAYDLSLIHI